MKKENVPLAIGLLIPVFLVLILAVIIFLPRLYVEPVTDFVYAVGDYPTFINTTDNTRTEYRVINGVFSSTTTPYEFDRPPFETTKQPEFYRYDVSEHKNTPLSLEDLENLTLDPSSTSPDGFTIGHPRSRDNFFEAIFGGQDYSQQVLEKGTVTIRLQTITAVQRDPYYQNNFVGWIVSTQ